MDIEAKLLQRVMDESDCETQTDAVEMALRELGRRKRFKEFAEKGSGLTPEELKGSGRNLTPPWRGGSRQLTPVWQTHGWILPFSRPETPILLVAAKISILAEPIGGGLTDHSHAAFPSVWKPPFKLSFGLEFRPAGFHGLE